MVILDVTGFVLSCSEDMCTPKPLNIKIQAMVKMITGYVHLKTLLTFNVIR